jgi:hypothetical protein
VKPSGIDPRTLALARRALFSDFDRGRIAFRGPNECVGSRRGHDGKLDRCRIQGHARRCRGGRTSWDVGRVSAVIPAFVILGSGDAPEKALADAVRRKSQESARWRAIEAERSAIGKRART